MSSGIWLDTDLALGAPSGDVDDGMALAALALAARTAGPALLGVSAVSGNTDGESALTAIRSLLAELGCSAPSVSEADAPQALVRVPEGTSVVAIGPPTNLVRACALDPAWAARVDVRAVGRVTSRLRHPLLSLFDLNFRTDPVATRAFFPTPWRSLRLFPLDQVKRLRFGAADLDRLHAASTAGAYLARHSRRWLRRARFVHVRGSFPVWDLPAALDAVEDLPEPAWDAGPPRLLRHFDVEATRERFFRLVEGPPVSTR